MRIPQRCPASCYSALTGAVVFGLLLAGCGDGATPQSPDSNSDEAIPVPAFRVLVSPGQSTIIEGEFTEFSVRLLDPDGKDLDVASVEWSSTDPAVAAVDQSGRAEGLFPGKVWIIAHSGEERDSANLSVLARAASIIVSPPAGTLPVGDSLELSAIVLDARGSEITDRAPIWSTSNPLVATVQQGLVIARDTGSALITSELDTALVRVSLTVTPEAFVSVSAGRGHTCAITTTARVYCWGANDHGQLGNNSTDPSSVPVQLSSTERFVVVSAGTAYTCGVTDTGTGYCWGDNSMMELGNANAGKVSLVPVRVAGIEQLSGISTSDMAQSCALKSDGTPYCWGYNRFGAVGNGSTADERTAITVIGGLRFLQLDAGYMRTCGISDVGAAYCWGRGGTAQLGNASFEFEMCTNRPCATSPVPVQGNLSFAMISTGATHTCGVSTNWEAYCWGWNEHGQLGTGSQDSSMIPEHVAGVQRFASISVASRHSCAVTPESEAYCWGENVDGALGNSSTINSSIPVAVAGGHKFEEVSAGHSHSCGLSSEGAAYCWGNNAMGQLGNGDWVGTAIPTPVEF